MKKSIPKFARFPAGALVFSIALLLSASCSSTRVNINEIELARVRINEPVLVIPPLTANPRLNIVAKDLGKYYRIEVPKRVNGGVIYAEDIPALNEAQSWNNLIKNGAVNSMEAASMAKNVGCNSALSVQILEIKQFPPFRIVVQLLWVDSSTGNIIGKLFQDIDVSDTETEHRFKSFSGQGPGQEVYERVMYSKDKYQTAYLMPQQFFHFAAAYSTRVLFGEASDFPWWFFWRTL